MLSAYPRAGLLAVKQLLLF